MLVVGVIIAVSIFLDLKGIIPWHGLLTYHERFLANCHDILICEAPTARLRLPANRSFVNAEKVPFADTKDWRSNIVHP